MNVSVCFSEEHKLKKIVLMLVAAAIMILYPLCSMIAVSVSGNKASCDTQSGISMVDQLAAVSVDSAQAQIDKAIEERKAKAGYKNIQNEVEKSIKQIEAGKKSYRQVFHNVYFMGDSLMDGLRVYGFLNPSRLITQVSASLSHLEGNMNSIISARPPVLVLHYGLNMISTSQAQLDSFISRYTKDIKKLQSALPKTRIIVSLIFPVDTSKATAPRFKAVGKYNKALVAMCKTLRVEVLDSTATVKANKQYNAKDGIHYSKSFYGNWLKFIMRNKEIY